MTSLVQSMTSLPNLHPALVHFPVALVFTALALEFVSLVRSGRIWLERSVAVLYALAAAGSVAAFFAGRAAADSVGAIPADAEKILTDHADSALWTMVVLISAALFRVAASVKRARLAEARWAPLRAVGMFTLTAGALLVAYTADLGGALVFNYGVAVTCPPQQAVPSSAPAPVGIVESSERRRSRKENDHRDRESASGGSVTRSIDLVPFWGTGSKGSIRSTAKGDGLELEVNGEGLLVLKGVYDDVAAEVHLDLGGFHGTAGLAHHVLSTDSGVLFTVSTEGTSQLYRKSKGKTTQFDSASIPVPSGVVKLRVTAVGRHLKGFLDGKTVVHGHGTSGSPGRPLRERSRNRARLLDERGFARGRSRPRFRHG